MNSMQGLTNRDSNLSALTKNLTDIIAILDNHGVTRKSPGREMALDEIKRKHGTSYDEQAVDICVHLFEKENYSFPIPARNNL